MKAFCFQSGEQLSAGASCSCHFSLLSKKFCFSHKLSPATIFSTYSSLPHASPHYIISFPSILFPLTSLFCSFFRSGTDLLHKLLGPVIWVWESIWSGALSEGESLSHPLPVPRACYSLPSHTELPAGMHGPAGSLTTAARCAAEIRESGLTAGSRKAS